MTPCTTPWSNNRPRNALLSSRSRHPGGVQVLVADGSARFVDNDIDLDTWQRFGMPADGLPMEPF